MRLEEFGEFFGSELAAPGVEENDGMGRAAAGFVAEFQEGGLVWQLDGLCINVPLNALDVVVG